MQEALVERVERAVQQPVDIRLHDLPDASGTQLIIAAPLDSGGRGRPRVRPPPTPPAMLSFHLAHIAQNPCMPLSCPPVQHLAGTMRSGSAHKALVKCILKWYYIDCTYRISW